MCIGLARKRKWESDSFPFKLIKSKSYDKYIQGVVYNWYIVQICKEMADWIVVVSVLYGYPPNNSITRCMWNTMCSSGGGGGRQIKLVARANNGREEWFVEFHNEIGT